MHEKNGPKWSEAKPDRKWHRIFNFIKYSHIYYKNYKKLVAYIQYTYATRCGDRFVEKFTYLSFSRPKRVKLNIFWAQQEINFSEQGRNA